MNPSPWCSCYVLSIMAYFGVYSSVCTPGQSHLSDANLGQLAWARSSKIPCCQLKLGSLCNKCGRVPLLTNVIYRHIFGSFLRTITPVGEIDNRNSYVTKLGELTLVNLSRSRSYSHGPSNIITLLIVDQACPLVLCPNIPASLSNHCSLFPFRKVTPQQVLPPLPISAAARRNAMKPAPVSRILCWYWADVG